MVGTETIASQLLASKEMICTFLGILLWDTLATLPSERRFMWPQKWSLLKVSYLINRYWTIGAQISTAVMMLSKVPAGACKRIFWVPMLNSISVIVICDCVLAIRVWAVWERSRKMGLFLATCLVSELILMVFSAWQLEPVSLPPDFAKLVNFHGCTAGNDSLPNRRMVATLYWSPTLLFNGACLAFIFLKHVQLSRSSNRLPIMQRLVRDGVLYFCVVFATDIPNMVFCSLSNQPGLDSIFAFPSLTIKSLMCSRMVLSLHETGSQKLVPNSGGSEKKRMLTPPDTLLRPPSPSSSPWWSPGAHSKDDALTARGKATLARRRQTLPNLNFNFPSKEQKERDFRGGGSLQVPPKAVSTSSSSLGSYSLDKGGGGSSWASAYAPTLPLTSVDMTLSNESSSESDISGKKRNSGSIVEEEEK
ncbi:hypothetical protein JCM5350_001096 [Sporobolomyces pararoseus]